VEIIEAVCCVSGSLNYVEDIRSKTGADSLAAAVRSNDTPAIFDWMMDSFSYQGISNRVADQYIRQHGNATWRQIARLLASSPPCPRLVNYWSFDGCRYDKTSQCCAEPEHMDRCPVPTHRLRNGRLNQAAYDFFFFIRDLAASDFPGWIDDQLAGVDDNSPNKHQQMQDALIHPMRHIYGVSDKVLAMTLSSVLIAAPEARPGWFEAGSHMIVVDSLVHNFLHRTGVLAALGAAHLYGPACYQPGRCADILRLVSGHIDARRFNRRYPANFPRFIQHALWHYCAADGDNVCNGNSIDDLKSCENNYCILFRQCSRTPLKRI
jgi:hypothetical protein